MPRILIVNINGATMIFYVGVYFEITKMNKNNKYIKLEEIEEKAKLESGIIDCLWSNERWDSNYYSYEDADNIIGVPHYTILDNEFFFNDLEINNEDIFDNLSKDKKFMKVAAKLKHAYGEHFKIHFGMYSQNA